MEEKGIKEIVTLAKRALEEGKDLRIRGFQGGAKGLFLAELLEEGIKAIVIFPSEEGVEKLAEDIHFFSQKEIALPTFWDPFGLDSPQKAVSNAILKFHRGEVKAILTTPEGLLVKIPERSFFEDSIVKLKASQELNRNFLIEKLINLGYERVFTVENQGEISVRGGILDVFSPNYDNPIRIEFSDNLIESIRLFDPLSQRSIERLEEVEIIPISFDGFRSLLEEFNEPLVIFEPDQVENRLREIEPTYGLFSYDEYLRHLFEKRPKLLLNGFFEEAIYISSQSFSTLRDEIKARGLKALLFYLKQWLEEGYRVTLVFSSPYQAQRFSEILENYGLKGSFSNDLLQGFLTFKVGNLSEGFLLEKEKLIYLTEWDIFGRRIPKIQKAPRRPLTFELDELKPGDPVVHVDYGIGIFRGLRRLDVNGEKEFLLIEYEGGDKLYVPIERMNLVHRWIGPSDTPPKLSKLGGPHWQRAKKRAKRAVQEVAKELLELYALRKTRPGYAFSPPDALFKEFEATFPYEETPDQLEAIEAVLRDMCSPTPMDRLICGDVGFGKTEVAIRAAFKAVMDGKQVAMLVPTTVLAEQHYRTFCERFNGYPIVIEMLSRFKTAQEQQKILKGLRTGSIDVVIGTHRLLSKDVVFKDLGLLIIDEEQRFGVVHKERLKELKKTVDCLTLTATPIPRTLQMALIGLKEISLINTPPPGRQTVKTRIIPFDPKLIKGAIREEIDRGGQVFFIHNRVASIYQRAKFLKELLPELRIEVAHGQMQSKQLERVMMRFVRGEIDVLVSTSIVELGLDIPNVNTIIIDDAHTFGLSDLYQLRGRVGRSWKKAYAYLIIPSPEKLSKEARKRLKAIEELSSFGSGFRLALRDLEIRGAGTIFGHRQSGHILDIGLELYNQMLEQALKELKGEKIKEEITPEIQLPIRAFIPEEYVEDDTQRLLLYHRLAKIKTEEELIDIKEELQDRFGPLPKEVLGLLEVIDLKIKLQKLGITKLQLKDSELRIKMSSQIDPNVLIYNFMKKDVKLTPSMELVVKVKEDWRKTLGEIINLLSGGNL
jgi:transcription-repair coupling factor (superfamily II helicase)